jgi:hypothetical protein
MRPPAARRVRDFPHGDGASPGSRGGACRRVAAMAASPWSDSWRTGGEDGCGARLLRLISPHRTGARRCRPKPKWVAGAVIRLCALMPHDGCRKIAATFNRAHAHRGETVGKSYVASLAKRRALAILSPPSPAEEPRHSSRPAQPHLGRRSHLPAQSPTARSTNAPTSPSASRPAARLVQPRAPASGTAWTGARGGVGSGAARRAPRVRGVGRIAQWPWEIDLRGGDRASTSCPRVQRPGCVSARGPPLGQEPRRRKCGATGLVQAWNRGQAVRSGAEARRAHLWTLRTGHRGRPFPTRTLSGSLHCSAARIPTPECPQGERPRRPEVKPSHSGHGRGTPGDVLAGTRTRLPRNQNR